MTGVLAAGGDHDRPGAVVALVRYGPGVVVAAALTALTYAVYHDNGIWLADLGVYRRGGLAVLNHTSVYADQWPQFTNSPFSAALFTLLARGSLTVVGLLWTFLSILCLIGAIAVTLRAVRAAPGTGWSVLLAPAIAVLLLWIDPVTTTLLLGQVNIVLAALILADLCRPDGSRFKGAGVGLAAGLKLFPGILIVYLLVTRRFRAALVALGTFAATVAIGFAVLPGDSARYWGGLVFDVRRVAPLQDIYSESVTSVLTRWSHGAGWVTAVATVLSVLAAGFGVWLARRLHRQGQELLAVLACLVAALLATPVSWNHYWTFVSVPLLVYLGWRAVAERSPGFGLLTVLLAAHEYANPEKWTVARTTAADLRLGLRDLLCTTTYLVLAVVILTALTVFVSRRVRHTDP